MSSPSLYLFNPDHDLALANGDPHYMPPAPARQLAADLALLPAWYACANDFVLAPSAYNKAYLERLKEMFPQMPSMLTPPEVAGKELALSPWGWNPAVHTYFRTLGVDARLLPSQAQLEAIRRCSSRAMAVDLLPRLLLNDGFCGESCYFTRLEEVRAFVESNPRCLLKAPLSGSGKGLNWCRGVFGTHLSNWCAHVLKQQGGVVGEPHYEKETDFAMQFWADASGRVSFRGYSLFYTNPGGAYEGSFLESDAAIEQRLSEQVPTGHLSLLKRRLEEELSLRVGGTYTGYVGVDMMICRFPEGYRIHPCVEVNLRMNMGMTARLLCDNYLSAGSTGTYRVAYHASNELQELHRSMEALHPLRLSGGRVEAGYLPLAAVTPHARYLAYAVVSRKE